MKRTFLVFFIAVLVLCGRVGALAQESEHFKFMGISMGLNEKAFVKELKKKGFKSQKNSDGNIYITGMFRNMEAMVSYTVTPVSKRPWIASISMSMPDWYAVKQCYNTLKGDFFSKYGEPDVVQEDIPTKYTGRELEYLSDKDNNFQTIWQLNNGAILLNISSYYFYGDYKGHLIIQYIDSANRLQEANERISDL